MSAHADIIACEPDRYDRVRASVVNQELLVLIALLRTAWWWAADVLDDHPEDCPCPGCRGSDFPDEIRQDLRTAVGVLDMLAGSLAGMVVGHRDRDDAAPADTYAAHLRLLADRIDAIPDDGAAEATPDEPAVVGPRP